VATSNSVLETTIVAGETDSMHGTPKVIVWMSDGEVTGAQVTLDSHQGRIEIKPGVNRTVISILAQLRDTIDEAVYEAIKKARELEPEDQDDDSDQA